MSLFYVKKLILAIKKSLIKAAMAADAGSAYSAFLVKKLIYLNVSLQFFFALFQNCVIL